MNTEQLRKIALAATPGPWIALQICKGSGWVDVVTRENTGRYSLPFVACKHFSEEANAAHIAAANPATILALLECVDALRGLLNHYDPYALPGYEKNVAADDNARASLKNLEAL